MGSHSRPRVRGGGAAPPMAGRARAQEPCRAAADRALAPPAQPPAGHRPAGGPMTRVRAQPVLPYGGQAVIEGVMMRGVRVLAVAVRAPDQRIVIQTRPLSRIYRGRLSRLPFLRGLLG